MLMARQMRPPFSFWSYPKRERAAPGVREKGALAATLHVRAKLLYGGRREMVPAGLRWLPDGRGGVRYRLDGGFPRRECGRESGCKDAFDQLLFPRVSLRYALPGARRSCCVGPCCSFHQPPASGSENRRRVYPCTSPGWRFPQGPDVSVPDRRKGQPTFPRRRQEVCACADRPAEAFFLFGPCTARFSFGKTKREMGGAFPSYQHS